MGGVTWVTQHRKTSFRFKEISMNRNILGFCIGLLVCTFDQLHAQQTSTFTAKSNTASERVEQASGDAGGSPVVAQAGDSVAETRSSSETEKNEVKNYKSFTKHVENEHRKLKVTPTTIENGPIKSVLREKGIEFSTRSIRASTKDNTKVAYQSPDKKGISLLDTKLRHVEIYNSNGEIIRTVPLPKFPDGAIAFSTNRLFVIKGCFGWRQGFEIYDLSGNLVKDVDEDCVDGYVVSNNQKYFAVTGGMPSTGDFFIIYDMDGNEVWRQKVVLGGDAKIQFSLDDKFAIVKMPIYWDGVNNKSRKERKVYLFDIFGHKLISEENYEK